MVAGGSGSDRNVNGAGAGAGTIRPNTLRPATCGGGCGGGLRATNGCPMMLSRWGAIVAPMPRTGARRTCSMEKEIAAPEAGRPCVKDPRGTTVTAEGTIRFT